jgi:hypothetical protein
MKLFAVVTIALLLPFAARAQSTKFDCSKGAAGTVTLNSTTDRLSLDAVVLEAYSECLLLSNSVVQAEEARVMTEANKAQADARVKCVFTDAKAIELESWISGRMSNGQTGGTATYLIQHPVSCGPAGSGLFEGTVSSSWIKLEITENYKSNDQGDTGIQTATIQLLGVTIVSTQQR